MESPDHYIYTESPRACPFSIPSSFLLPLGSRFHFAQWEIQPVHTTECPCAATLPSTKPSLIAGRHQPDLPSQGGDSHLPSPLVLPSSPHLSVVLRPMAKLPYARLSRRHTCPGAFIPSRSFTVSRMSGRHAGDSPQLFSLF